MKIVNIMDWIDSVDVGEDMIKSVLSSFSCPINPEVENFIHKSAYDFAKKKTAITYLIFDDDKNLIGYFTVTHKSITIKESALSKSVSKKIHQYAVLNEDGSFVVSAFLIAQLAKNQLDSDHLIISGEELLGACKDIIAVIQHMIGGRIIILECEKDNPKLVDFYTKNGFCDFDTRTDKDGNKYRVFLQLL